MYKYLITLFIIICLISLPVTALNETTSQAHVVRSNRSYDDNIIKPTPVPTQIIQTQSITVKPTPVPTQIKSGRIQPIVTPKQRITKTNTTTQIKPSNNETIQLPKFNTTLSPILTKIPKNTIYYIITGLLLVIFVIGMIFYIKKNKKRFRKRKPKRILEITTNIDELYEETPKKIKKQEPEPKQEPENKPKKKKKLKSLLDQDFEF